MLFFLVGQLGLEHDHVPHRKTTPGCFIYSVCLLFWSRLAKLLLTLAALFLPIDWGGKYGILIPFIGSYWKKRILRDDGATDSTLSVAVFLVSVLLSLSNGLLTGSRHRSIGLLPAGRQHSALFRPSVYLTSHYLWYIDTWNAEKPGPSLAIYNWIGRIFKQGGAAQAFDCCQLGPTRRIELGNDRLVTVVRFWSSLTVMRNVQTKTATSVASCSFISLK